MKKTAAKDLAVNGGKPVREHPPEQKVLTDETEINEVVKVIKSGKLTSLSSDVVEKFENEFAGYCGAKYAIAVNSGTAALHVALAALDIGPGDEVIVPPYTFIATASAVLQQNALPVFADIKRDTLNIDPVEIEKKITPRTKAIIPVHIFGMPAEMKAINRVARRHNIPVIEDACQAHGATIDGKMVGNFGKLACFSFQESKNMATGEGGIIVTNNRTLAEKCRIIRHIGMKGKYEYVTLGYNYRMPAMSAAVGLAQLKKLPDFNRYRAETAEYFRRKLTGLPIEFIDAQKGIVSANHLFPFVLKTKTIEETYGIYSALCAENIPVWWVYPRPIYSVEFFKDMKVYPKSCPFCCGLRNEKYNCKDNECPVAEEITRSTLVLPVAPCYSSAVKSAIVKAMWKVIPFYCG
ncbi:MAG TPA: DegT/DnrJ/EryC1/StrS family aminotransferase [bacterium]|nr:DegT/DnrJ/EryC1/StrS family aminotransferase [bacterium]